MKYCAILLSILLFSCGSSDSGFVAKPTSLRAYYFDYKQLFEPEIRKFCMNMDLENFNYWHMQTSVEEGDTFFTTKLYDNDLDLLEICVEQIIPNGSKMIEYTKYIDGEPIKSTVIEDEVFKWDHEERRKITWSIEFDFDEYTERVTKKRKFLGVEGDEYTAAKFRDEYVIQYTLPDTTVYQNYHHVSHYSHNLGLLHYDRFVPGKGTEEVVSFGRFTAEEWAAKLRSKTSN